MNTAIQKNAAPPEPQVPLSFRVGTMDDVPFMDELQKMHSRALGRFPFAQYEGYVKMGAVLVAEEATGHSPLATGQGVASDPSLTNDKGQVANGTPVGFIISRDRYLKRDELGVIFQLCVKPGVQRKFVGAALVAEAFRRSAYGCRLYCLWCAQDLEANYFWESLGFVPLAFRAGSDRKRRVHIFWQKRIVEGDTETKWWYPFQTTGGALRADRIVFPIPDGTHWKDVRAVVIPEVRQIENSPRSHGDTEARSKSGRASVSPCLRGEKDSSLRPMGGFKFQSEVKPKAKPAKEKKPKASAARIDPKYLRAARELRDRYLEHVNANGGLLPAGKYDVSKTLPAPGAVVGLDVSPAPLPTAPRLLPPAAAA